MDEPDHTSEAPGPAAPPTRRDLARLVGGSVLSLGAAAPAAAAVNAAAPQVRRVVTGHDAQGRARFISDGAAPVRGVSAHIWSSATPADNADLAGGEPPTVAGFTNPGGAVMRLITFTPGGDPLMHRTRSLDYAIVTEGEVVLELDDGVAKTLKAGDVVVQRGTMHQWVNRSGRPATVAFILVDALPLEVGGRPLPASHP
jgi:quercetin dioxygenase-like cupin family protein